MPTVHLHYQNLMLAALPADDRRRLADSLELVTLTSGQSVYEPASPILDVFFPTTAIVSLLCEIDDGSMAEVAVVGNEGIVGVALFMGGEATLSRATVQRPGQAFRLKGRLLRAEFHRAAAMQRILLHYTQALLVEMAQTLVCVRHHTLDEQFCRWLLRRFDRWAPEPLAMSQEMIAQALGIRRTAVSERVVGLRQAGLIASGRGRIALLDRRGLEERACACYAVIRKEFARLLPATPGAMASPVSIERERRATARRSRP